MKIGVLQLNPVVGDLEGNAAKIDAGVREAARLGAEWCLTSELALTGYPPRDLLLYEGFVDQARAVAEHLARDLADAVPLLLGSVEKNTTGQGKPSFNCALWCEGGSIRQTFRKTLLPTYDVFDEARYFEPAPAGDDRANILEFGGQTIGVTICERSTWDSAWFSACWRPPPPPTAAPRLIVPGIAPLAFGGAACCAASIARSRASRSALSRPSRRSPIAAAWASCRPSPTAGSTPMKTSCCTGK